MIQREASPKAAAWIMPQGMERREWSAGLSCAIAGLVFLFTVVVGEATAE